MRRRRPRLATEAFHDSRIFDNCVRQELQSDHAAEFEIFGFVDHTHPTATELFDDAVVRDGLPEHWRESYGLTRDKSMKVDKWTARGDGAAWRSSSRVRFSGGLNA